MDHEKIRNLAEAVLDVEAQAIVRLKQQINDDFMRACGYMLACEGRIVVTGMGKSGHIGNKIAATLASTGSPAFFMHPGEASHGDLGMITPKDVVVALSNSGETDEILTILPLIKRMKVPLITLTGNPRSRLAVEAEVNLDVSVEQEACPLGLAPTASTTAALAMGDALAVSLLESRGFTSDDFALSHPGGRLGRRLLLHIGDIMHRDDGIPRVNEEATLGQALLEMTNKGLGMTAIVDAKDRLLGVFTDGDLRRLLDHNHMDVHTMQIAEHMTRDPRHARADMLAAEAVQLMEQYKISALPVVDDQLKLIGAFNMHDLLRAGVV
ncbi:MAG: KpsF/GutQ family sugar-phosphate isomerase [Gammaproteobacteria bacterium]|nr:KpsF/GutQ family sugar-phosphate isomerase [Gammaproteobacteria bacterium]